MENNQLQIKNKGLKELIASPAISEKFKELLKDRAPQFTTSLLQCVANSDMLANATPMSVINAAFTAATLNLPINQNLGLAYIVPYKSRQKDGSYIIQAQFQIGYKGFIQLAQRTGQFKRLSAGVVYEGQLIIGDFLQGYKFDFSKPSTGNVIGYVSYFKLLNGFESTLYITKEQAEKHAKKFSKSFGKGSSVWDSDFDSMGVKTAIKSNLTKYAPLSIEMEKAVVSDQAIITDEGKFHYVDNVPDEQLNPIVERYIVLINDSKSSEEIAALNIPEDIGQLEEIQICIENKLNSLSNEN
jgi:recombination protein RecT